MEKTDKEKQQSIDEIGKRAEKEIATLTDAQRGIISEFLFILMAQAKLLADELGVSYNSILVVLFLSINTHITSEQDCAVKKPKFEKTAFTFKPPKNGFLQ